MVIKPMYPIFQAFDQKRQRGTHFPFHNRLDPMSGCLDMESSPFLRYDSAALSLVC